MRCYIQTIHRHLSFKIVLIIYVKGQKVIFADIKLTTKQTQNTLLDIN